MSVRNPKSRLISFRLSEGEYRELQTLCDAKEARSLSDFVRSTVQGLAGNGDPSHADRRDWSRSGNPVGVDKATFPVESSSNGWELMFARELLELSRRTDALDREIRRLSLLLTRP